MCDDKIIGMISVVRDITERKLAEESLRESEKKYRGILENIHDSYFELDLKGNLVFFNDAQIEKTGYSREELMGMNYRQYLAPESWKTVSGVFSGIYRTGQAAKIFDYEVITKEGQKKHFESWADLLFDNNNKKIGFRGMARDITNRKRRQEELQRINNFLNLIIENIPIMLFMKDAKDLRFVRFNRAGEELLGYSRSDLLGKNDYDFFPKDQADFFTGKDREVLSGKEVVDIPEESVKTLNKGERIMHTKKVPIIGAKGEPEYLLGISEDITDRKLAEKILQQTLNRLRKSFDTIIQVMVIAVEARDPYTSGHQKRSASLAHTIAKEMGLSGNKIEALIMAGPIHDIGKLSIPAEILSKPGKLSDVEFSLIKEHARIGFEMLKDVESPWPLADIVHQHHERMDGSGYPKHLKGDEILIEARILAVADVVESMASHRPYRPALGIDAALDEIVKNRGRLYDPEVVDACLRLFNEKGYKLAN
jgi:PAS domain S-box-containing protein